MIGPWSLIPLPWKIGIYAALIGILLASFWWYRNSLINLGKERGRQEAASEIERAKSKEWEESSKRLEAEAEKLKFEREGWERKVKETESAISLERATLRREREANEAVRNKIYTDLKSQLELELEAIRTTADSNLDDTLRSLSRRIDEWKASQRSRTAPNS